jgi:hypothetical protein
LQLLLHLVHLALALLGLGLGWGRGVAGIEDEDELGREECAGEVDCREGEGDG